MIVHFQHYYIAIPIYNILARIQTLKRVTTSTYILYGMGTPTTDDDQDLFRCANVGRSFFRNKLAPRFITLRRGWRGAWSGVALIIVCVLVCDLFPF